MSERMLLSADELDEAFFVLTDDASYGSDVWVAADSIKAHIRALVVARTDANNHWRLDYMKLADERDALLERLREVRALCERESERFPRVMGDFAREVLNVLSSAASSELGGDELKQRVAEPAAEPEE